MSDPPLQSFTGPGLSQQRVNGQSVSVSNSHPGEPSGTKEGCVGQLTECRTFVTDHAVDGYEHPLVDPQLPHT
jgi:hypothetical protein